MDTIKRWHLFNFIRYSNEIITFYYQLGIVMQIYHTL